jgi:hypothetical protein
VRSFTLSPAIEFRVDDDDDDDRKQTAVSGTICAVGCKIF